jgi:ADP-ribose pyrophosphatase YjhB (NUDIX family)
MISFRSGDGRFHLRAGAVVVDQEHVLLHRLEGDVFWALPGGRIDMGEQGQQTIVREFLEELTLAVECGPLLCAGENFFEYQGEPHHEVSLYFAVTLPQTAFINNKTETHWGTEGNRRLEFGWFPLSELDQLDFRPVALRDALFRGTLPVHFVEGRRNAV